MLGIVLCELLMLKEPKTTAWKLCEDVEDRIGIASVAKILQATEGVVIEGLRYGVSGSTFNPLVGGGAAAAAAAEVAAGAGGGSTAGEGPVTAAEAELAGKADCAGRSPRCRLVGGVSLGFG